MVASRKPLIVHNGYLDLMHVKFTLVRFTIVLSKIYLANGIVTEGNSFSFFRRYTTTNIYSPTLLLFSATLKAK